MALQFYSHIEHPLHVYLITDTTELLSIGQLQHHATSTNVASLRATFLVR